MSVRPSSSPETSKYQLIRDIVQKPIRGYMSQPLINEILKHNEIAGKYKVNDIIEGYFDNGEFIINDGTSISSEIIETYFKLVNGNTTPSGQSSAGGAVKSKKRMRRRSKRSKKTMRRRPRKRSSVRHRL